jgi:hypothetical protein
VTALVLHAGLQLDHQPSAVWRPRTDAICTLCCAEQSVVPCCAVLRHVALQVKSAA